VGTEVGETEGSVDGVLVPVVGWTAEDVGLAVVGLAVGPAVGLRVGEPDGAADGFKVGLSVGLNVGGPPLDVVGCTVAFACVGGTVMVTVGTAPPGPPCKIFLFCA